MPLPSSELPTILVVDDEPLLRMVLVDLFEEANFPVCEAENAAEALQILQSEGCVRVVITDVQMPGSMDGIKLAQFIHDAFPPIALIVASGAVTPRADELPEAAIFMPKPVNSAELLKLVQTLSARAERG